MRRLRSTAVLLAIVAGAVTPYGRSMRIQAMLPSK